MQQPYNAPTMRKVRQGGRKKKIIFIVLGVEIRFAEAVLSPLFESVNDMREFLRHLDACVSITTAGYGLYVRSCVEQVYSENVPGAMPCDMLLVMPVSFTTGQDAFSPVPLCGRINIFSFAWVIAFGVPIEFKQFVIRGVHNCGRVRCVLRFSSG